MLKELVKTPLAGVAVGTLVCGFLIAGPSLAISNGTAPVIENNIDWSAAEASAAATAEREQTASEAFLALTSSTDATALPVMLFGVEAGLSIPAFVSQGSAYAAFYAEDGIQLSISGSKAVVQAPDSLTLYREPTAFENIGDGADYSLQRFGASYTLRITCHQPTEDTRCTQPDYLTELASTLFVVEGQANEK
ncbi:MAG: hypothetical protein ABJF50_12890 [Paracoccaceae bacterium]|uniref:hypothetical protein n=1 Tax=Hyphomonas sp. TaxID=87 RepID=UPI00328A1F0A